MSSRFIRFGSNLRVVPAIHNRLAFARLIERGLEEDDWKPDVVAVELPESVRDALLEGLGYDERAGPLWVGRRVGAHLERVSTENLTGFQHTRRAVEATARAILAARRWAADKLEQSPSVPADEWITRCEAGFEPVVFVFPGDEPGRGLRTNIIWPDRVSDASYAYTKERRRVSSTLWNGGLGGRLWFTPPFHVDDRWKRAEWLAEAGAGRAPRAMPKPTLEDGADWRRFLTERAIVHARAHVLLIAPRYQPPPSDLADAAKARGVQLVHAPMDIIEPIVLDTVARDEFEHDPTHHAEAPDPVLEAFSLHSGDAYIAALRFARDNGADIELVDLDIDDSHLMRRALTRRSLNDDRRKASFFDDAALMEVGLHAFYARLRHAAAAARIECIDLPRERRMASRLKQLIRADKQILFVCGAAHWEPISAMLADPKFRDEEPQPDTIGEAAQLYCSGPFSWAAGGDELPLTLALFERARRAGRGGEFHPMTAAAAVLARVSRRLAQSPEVSPADIITFTTYLGRLCLETSVVAPRWSHYVEAARSCLGTAGRRIVHETVTTTWRTCPDDLPKISGIRAGNDGVHATIEGGPPVVLVSRGGALEFAYDAGRGKMSAVGGPGATAQLTARSPHPDDRPVLYSDARWERHLREMNLKARRLASPRVARTESEPVVHSQTGRIDGRASVRARVRGRRQVYQFADQRALLKNLNPFEGFDPIVWAFEPAVERDFRYICFDGPMSRDPFGLRPGVQVTSHTRCGPGLEESRTDLLALWTPLFADSDPHMLKRLYRWVRRGALRHIPRERAFAAVRTQRSWADASAVEEVLAVALDTCRSYVVLVSDAPPSARVRRRFKQCARQLLHVPKSAFTKAEIEALRTQTCRARDD